MYHWLILIVKYLSKLVQIDGPKLMVQIDGPDHLTLIVLLIHHSVFKIEFTSVSAVLFIVIISDNGKQWVLQQHQNDNDVVKGNVWNQVLNTIPSSIKDFLL